MAGVLLLMRSILSAVVLGNMNTTQGLESDVQVLPFDYITDT